MDVECPYCQKALPDERSACCGEVGHAVPIHNIPPKPCAEPYVASRADVCIDCDGLKTYPSGEPCKSCSGTGLVMPGDGEPIPPKEQQQ